MISRLFAAFVGLTIATAAAAQDIRGLEVCTAEKIMERRTSCLQSNVEFLQQVLAKQARETQARLNAAGQDAAAQKAEIAALKAELAKLQRDLAELKKEKPSKQ
jgi:septal ring factor EnvC (AmiA/AmiB activator)